MKNGEDFVYLNCKTQSIIDWYKFSVNLKFDRNNQLIRNLFKKLTLNIDEYEDKGPTAQYEHRLVYGENFVVLTNPRPGKSVERTDVGLDYFFIDMDGTACREFESRCNVYNSSWKDLHNYILKNIPFHFTRYDVAKDTFDKSFDLNLFKRKINNHEYISCFRGTGKVEYVPILPNNKDSFDGETSPRVKEYMQAHNMLSYSATFGTKQSVQMQAYDKLVERSHKGVDVPFDQWIRFEMRFCGNKADECFIQATKAINKNEFDIFSSSLLLGLIDFKQCTVKGKIRNSFDVKNARKYDRWSCWSNFIEDVDPLKLKPLKSIVPYDQKVEHMSIWDHTASGQTLSLIFAAAPDKFHDYCDMIVAHYIERGKFGNEQREYINGLRRKYGKGEISYIEFLDLFESCFVIRKGGNLKDLKSKQKQEVLDLFKEQFEINE